PRALSADFAAGYVILGRRVLHVADLLSDPATPPASREWAEWLEIRSVLWVPLLRDDEAIGVISVSRSEAGHFSDDQVKLLQTFADQAVIAIENVRLFNETKEALEQQTATGDILRVISSSPTDAQPVFEAITQSAMRLCDGTLSVVSRYDGELIHLGAYTHVSAEGVELIRRRFPMQPMRDNLHGRVVLEGGVVHIPDVQADSEFNQAISQALGTRSTLGVPMLLDGRVVGAIAVARPDVRPFTDKQIALLKTFADQAVIAIENVRLFNETKDALDRQTATSEILRVIGSSPTNAQPVFETIARSGIRVCGALGCVVFIVDGGMLHVAATHGIGPERVVRFNAEFPKPLASADIAAARTIRERSVFHLVDFEHNPNATALDIEN